jgi:hypothetical protein
MLTPVGVDWIATTIGGKAQADGSADGPGTEARFFLPSGLAIDLAGSLFIADANNNTVHSRPSARN